MHYLNKYTQVQTYMFSQLENTIIFIIHSVSENVRIFIITIRKMFWTILFLLEFAQLRPVLRLFIELVVLTLAQYQKCRIFAS